MRSRRGVCALVVVMTAALLVSSGTPAVARGPRPAPADAPCDWPMWGRDDDRTFSTTCSDLSVQNASELRRIWFFNTHDVVTATPAVVDGVAYVGDWSGRFYALRVKDGKRLWMFKAPHHPNVYAGQIVSSAAVEEIDGQRIVFVGSGKTLYALRAEDGQLAWKHELNPEGGADDPTEIETSPAVVDGMVLVGYDVHNSGKGEPAGVAALDATDGTVRWQTTTAPTEGEGATGPGCGDVWSSPTADAERRLVFVGTGNCVTSPKGYGRFAEAMIALDLDDGSVRWTYQPHQPNRDDLDFAGAPNLFAIDGRAVVGLGNKDGAYYAVDRETGELVWSTTVAEPGLTRPGSNFSTGGFIGPTAVADGIVAGGTAIGGSPFLHGLDASTGAVVWQQPEAAATYGAPAVANGVLIIGGTDFTIRALDLATGAVLWRDEVQGAVSGGAAIVGPDVFAVAGIREPNTRKRSRTSGVYRYSLEGEPVTSTTTDAPAPKPKRTPRTTPGATQECVGAPCDVGFTLVEPPPGTSPEMTMELRTDPWKATITTSGLGPPSAWIRAGSPDAAAGATRYGVFISESDDNPQGGLLCVLGADGSCTTTKIPRAGATYSRITVLAITDSNELPSPTSGVNRLVVTKSFDPPLAPAVRSTKKSSDK